MSLSVSTLLANAGFMNVLVKIGTILLAILVLLLMITIHELGHYTFGKMLKFKINEFAVGFGKAIYQKTKANGEKISLRIIPLGGYCAFEGEDEDAQNPQAFNNQAPWKRLIVLFGGVLFNFISAIFFSVILLTAIGNGHELRVNYIEGPNTEIIYENDVIVRVNDKKPSYLNGGVAGLTRGVLENEEVSFVVIRNGERVELKVEKQVFTQTNEATGEEQQYLAFGIGTSNVPLSLGNALLQSVPFSFEIAWECLVILGQLLTGHYGIKDVGGPITTIAVIADASAVSLNYLLLFLPLIAINLAVFNLLPIPALDGARMVFVLIEWIRGKPIKRELEGKIHMVGLIVLMSLVILIDILHFII